MLADSLLHRESGGLRASSTPAPGWRSPSPSSPTTCRYSDANLLEILLQRFGGAPLADRLTAIAGPKVYSSMKRRFSSLCFGTIKTPQSSALSTEDAVMNAREVAPRCAACRSTSRTSGWAWATRLLVFGEGTRSRSSGMQPLLPGVSRYLEGPGTWVLPVESPEPEELFPVETTRCTRCRSAIAPRPAVPGSRPARAGERATGELMMDSVGLAIAGLLPLAYRGAYADDAAGPGRRQASCGSPSSDCIPDRQTRPAVP